MMSSTKPVLYSFYRSSPSWRVRIALALKGVDYEYKAINLLKKEQTLDDYKKINPKGEIPCLFIDGHYLVQSVSWAIVDYLELKICCLNKLAIIEYLDETRTNGHTLLPKDPIKRAQARIIAENVNSGIQPYQNPPVLARVGDETKQEWLENFLGKGLAAIEETLKHTSGRYCVGDEVTIADICLVPQVYGAQRFKVSLDNYPLIRRINAELEKLPEFAAAHPSKQPDCPE